MNTVGRNGVLSARRQGIKRVRQYYPVILQQLYCFLKPLIIGAIMNAADYQCAVVLHGTENIIDQCFPAFNNAVIITI